MVAGVASAVLLVSHGTVDHLDDLEAFVTNVRRGQPPGAGLVAELRRRYEAIGGQSPLNAIDAELARKLEVRLGVRVAWANRLWRPYVRDVLAGLVTGSPATTPVRVALVPLAQHSAHVYAEDARRAAVGLPVDLRCADDWGNRPDLCAAFAKRIRAAMTAVERTARVTVVMTAHSLPKAVVARGDPYERELRKAAESIALSLRTELGGQVTFTVAFQSQGMSAPGADGRPIEWLGPDLRTAFDEAVTRGDEFVVLAPVGFLADHVEILYDLDIEARAMAAARNLRYARAASLNADDDLVDVLAAVANPLLARGA
ncbi:MAG: ferrochelatase [Myxococcota bacterium]|nr:ferrochelatase [Myxococcota bacterium]